MWEDHADCAYFGTLYHAGNRRVIACNNRAAELVGLHKEELLSRYARRDVEIPFVHTDWLANFVHDLDFAEEARNDRFIRWVVQRGPARRAVLVHNCKAKFFDAAGRVSRVSRHCAAATRRTQISGPTRSCTLFPSPEGRLSGAGRSKRPCSRTL